MACIANLMLDQKKDLKNHKFVSSQYASFWSSSSLLYVWIFCCDVLMSLNPTLGFQKKSTIFYEWTFTRYLLNPTYTYLTISTVYHGIPICSMYGIFTNICPKNDPNVGKYSSTMEHLGLNFKKTGKHHQTPGVFPMFCPKKSLPRYALKAARRSRSAGKAPPEHTVAPPPSAQDSSERKSLSVGCKQLKWLIPFGELT